MLFLSSDKFMPEMHVRQARFTYSVCEPFTKKNKCKYKRIKETGDSRYINQDKLDKLVFKLIWLM